MSGDGEMEVKSPDELDREEAEELVERTGREIAERGRVSTGWLWAGAVVVVLGFLMLWATWDWQSGSIGRYGANWQLNSLWIVMIGGLMVARWWRG